MTAESRLHLDSPAPSASAPKPPGTSSEAEPTASQAASHLKPASARPSLPSYVRQLWARRHFLHAQAWGQATANHQGTLLGKAWLVVAPLLDGLMYFLIFGVLLDAGAGISNFFGFLVIGIFLFSFSARAIASSVRCIHTNRGLLRAFSFPRASLPIATCWRELLNLAPVLGALLVLLVAVPPHATVTWTWLLFPVVVAMQFGLNLGLCLFAARLGTHFPDVSHLVPYFTRAWMYGSAVMFAIENFERFPGLPTLIENNPLYVALTISRDLLLHGTLPGSGPWLTMLAWSILTPLAGLVFFWQAEVIYGRPSIS